ncbi:hypothetical protein VKT23_010546 [Stygiomarasmius scandens]|uniref:F-box domain-containing protein n=1 Tax=Marasmiellus scandens TaxID=2682957 RepID=A0ABR1JCT2_9AGAR
MLEYENPGTSQALPDPIHRLPPELISEIFILYQDMHCTEEEKEFREYIGREPTSKYPLTTLTLGSVCSRWRNISLGTPSIWSRFLVEAGYYKRAIYHRLELYLSRSKPLPLSIDVVYDDESKEVSQLGFQSILCLLVEESHRWLHVRCKAWRITKEISTLLGVNRDFPLLHTLVLEGLIGVENPLDMFKGAFSLQKLVTDEINFNVHLNYLQHLCLTSVIDDRGIMFMVRKLADCFPALRALELEIEEAPADIMEIGAKELRFERLERLSLSFMTWSEIIMVFSVFTLPSLQKIVLANCQHDLEAVNEPYPYARAGSVITSFLSRSTCPLSVLEITGMGESSGLCVISSMLQSMPSLVELRLHEAQPIYHWGTYDSHFTTSSMQALYTSSVSVGGTRQESYPSQLQHSEFILPNLRNLDLLIDTSRPEFDRFAVVYMIGSRCIPGTRTDSVQRPCCLKSVKVAVLNRESRPGLALLQHLGSLKDAGMPIEL